MTIEPLAKEAVLMEDIVAVVKNLRAENPDEGWWDGWNAALVQVLFEIGIPFWTAWQLIDG